MPSSIRGRPCVIGIIAGVVVVEAVFFIERKLKIDDPVGAISVHGVCGTVGVLAVGIFANGKYGIEPAGRHRLERHHDHVVDGEAPRASPASSTAATVAGSCSRRPSACVVIWTVIFGIAFAFFKIQNALTKGGIRSERGRRDRRPRPAGDGRARLSRIRRARTRATRTPMPLPPRRPARRGSRSASKHHPSGSGGPASGRDAGPPRRRTAPTVPMHRPHHRHTFLGSDRAVARLVAQPVTRFLPVETSGGVLLLVAAVVALVWANSPWSSSYRRSGTPRSASHVGSFTLEARSSTGSTTG